MHPKSSLYTCVVFDRISLQHKYTEDSMRTINASKIITVPEGVTVTLKGRAVRVKGPRGTLTRDFSHQRIDLISENGGKTIRAELWFGNRLGLACIRTVLTHIKNMITGVTKGYLFKMRLVYAHFPIAVSFEKSGKEVQIRNYLGEKIVRIVEMLGDTTADKPKDSAVKDEIIIQGNDLDAVSQSCANIQQISKVKDKDIRKFLDGIYVSYRGNVVQEE